MTTIRTVRDFTRLEEAVPHIQRLSEKYQRFDKITADDQRAMRTVLAALANAHCKEVVAPVRMTPVFHKWMHAVEKEMLHARQYRDASSGGNLGMPELMAWHRATGETEKALTELRYEKQYYQLMGVKYL